MFFHVYVIESQVIKSLYIGSTTNLKKRIKEHNGGENKSTKIGIPWKFVYIETCLDKRDALRREKYLKSNQGGRLLRARIKEYLYSHRS